MLLAGIIVEVSDEPHNMACLGACHFCGGLCRWV
jgi:hypothetical protein